MYVDKGNILKLKYELYVLKWTSTNVSICKNNTTSNVKGDPGLMVPKPT
jgi:hypothetical protein